MKLHNSRNSAHLQRTILRHTGKFILQIRKLYKRTVPTWQCVKNILNNQSNSGYKHPNLNFSWIPASHYQPNLGIRNPVYVPSFPAPVKNVAGHCLIIARVPRCNNVPFSGRNYSRRGNCLSLSLCPLFRHWNSDWPKA